MNVLAPIERIISAKTMALRSPYIRSIEGATIGTRAGPGGIEDPRAFRCECLHHAAYQVAAAAALHWGNADNRLRFAIFAPPAANRRDQPLDIGLRRSLLAGELCRRDRVPRLTESDNLAFEVLGGKPLGHVFRQGAAERLHPFE